MSFFLGQAQAKLFAHDFFHVDLFVSYDYYLEYLKVPRAGTRPDFLGFHGKQTTIAVEAKGRSGGYDATAVEAAKQQAESIPGIIGHPQPTAYVHLAYFDGNEWCAYLEDPPQPRDAPSASVDPEILTLAYYDPIVAAVRTGGSELARIGGVPYLRTSFDDVDSHLLVRADIAELVPSEEVITAADRDSLRTVSARLYELALSLDSDTVAPKNEAPADDDDDDPRFIGDDGVGVELGPSWLERQASDDE